MKELKINLKNIIRYPLNYRPESKKQRSIKTNIKSGYLVLRNLAYEGNENIPIKY
ncbi:hypothetical protein KKHLCK_05835 [Candidatus Electrothrix laxa]|jgi:hypothetical protein|uniref:Uncharacterized protein n=1 Tax=Candidatus Electrothrix aarhusensis TaxID=1859131 RepID=A0A3S3QSL5_9BACT|nr:hypothetical protein H206_00867 [Candidatus Electrothrix aarhusensis]